MAADSDGLDPVMPSAAGCFGTTHWSVVLAAGVAFSPDGKRLAASGGGSTVQVWKVED